MRLLPATLLLAATVALAQHPVPQPGNSKSESAVPLPAPPAIGATAPDAPVLTLAEAEQIALENNPTLRQVELEQRIAEGRIRQAGLWPNPMVGYSGDEIRGGEFGGGKQGFFFEQPVVLGGKLRLGQEFARKNRDVARLEAEEQKLRVMNGVRIAYYRLLAAQELLAIETVSEQLAMRFAQTAHQLHNIGQLDEPEVLQAEIELDKASLMRRSQATDVHRAWNTLAAGMGKPEMERRSAEGALDADLATDPEQLLRALVTESPAVRIARAGVERAEVTLKRSQREPFPDLRIKIGVQNDRELLDGGVRRAGVESFAEIGIQIPLFNRNQGNIASARSEIDRARQEARRVELLLRERAATAAEAYAESRDAAATYKNGILPKAERAYKLLLARWSEMEASFPQVISAERGLLDSQAQYVAVLERLQQSSIALRGYLLLDPLEAPARPGEIDVPVRDVNLPSRTDLGFRER